MSGSEFFDYVSTLSDRTSVFIEAAHALTVSQFGDKEAENASTVLRVASLMISLDAANSISTDISNGFSAVENSINGR